MLTTFTFNFLVNLLAIRSGLKLSIDNLSLSNKITDRQFFVHGPGFNTPYWNFLAISDNKIQLLHTFISVNMLGSKVYNNNIYNYAQ